MLLPNVANEYLHLASAPDVHKRTYDLTVQSMKILVALAAASGIEGAVEPVGALQTFDTPEEAEHGRAHTESVRGLGITVKYLGFTICVFRLIWQHLALSKESLR